MTGGTEREDEGFSGGEPYNPLTIPNVALTLALEVLEQKLHPLPPKEIAPGPGIYLLYYRGGFAPYAPMAERNQNPDAPLSPIYAGKAVRSGTRKGISFRPSREKSVAKRLSAHAKSIEPAANLDIADFSCRYLIVEDAFIALAESVLISVFKPLWNQALDGFGNNPTGGPRSGQARSDWDVLHPGRVRGLGPPRRSEKDLIHSVEAHLHEADSSDVDSELARIRDRIRKYNLG